MEIKQDNTRVFVPSEEGTPMTRTYAEELFSALPEHLQPSLATQADIEGQRLRETGPQLRAGSQTGTTPLSSLSRSEKEDVLVDMLLSSLPTGKAATGYKMLENGKRLLSDGSVLYPDGRRIFKDGSILLPSSGKLQNFGLRQPVKPTTRKMEHVQLAPVNQWGNSQLTKKGNPRYVHYSREVTDNSLPPYAFRMRGDDNKNRLVAQGFDSYGNPSGPNFEDIVKITDYIPRGPRNKTFTNKMLRDYYETGDAANDRVESIGQAIRYGKNAIFPEIPVGYKRAKLNTRSPSGKIKDLPPTELE